MTQILLLLLGHQSSLAAMTSSSSELSETSTKVALDVTANILHQALSVNTISSDSINNILGSINSIAESSLDLSKGESVKSLLTLYNSLTMRDIITGQSSVDNIFNSFRTSVQSIGLLSNNISTGTIETPQTALEKQYDQRQSNSIQFQKAAGKSQNLKISITELNSKLFGNESTAYMSNALVILVNGAEGLLSNSTTGGSTITVELNHNDPTHAVDNSAVNFTTICIPGSKSSPLRTFICPESNIIINHNCTGKSGVYVSYCPVLKPVCKTSGSSDNTEQCRVIEYTSLYTKCSCEIYSSSNSLSHRFLSNGFQQAVDSSGILSLASMAEFTASDFKDSFSSIGDFASPDAFARSLTVILLIVVLWVGGFSLVVVCALRRRSTKKTDEDNKQNELKVKSATVSRSPIAICNNLQEYITEIFPSVFTSKSRIHRLVDEVKRHHRYLNILTMSKGDFGEKTRILIGLQLLTTQSLLIFLLSVFYDLQCPRYKYFYFYKIT